MSRAAGEVVAFVVALFIVGLFAQYANPANLVGSTPDVRFTVATLMSYVGGRLAGWYAGGMARGRAARRDEVLVERLTDAHGRIVNLERQVDALRAQLEKQAVLLATRSGRPGAPLVPRRLSTLLSWWRQPHPKDSRNGTV